MRQFQKIVMAYFIIGVVMWGGGAIEWSDAGVAQLFVDVGGGGSGGGQSVAANESTSGTLEGFGESINSVVAFAIGGVQLFWNLIVGVVAFMHWPLVVLVGLNAPVEVTVLLGGGFVAAFYLSIAGIVVTS